MSSPALTNYVNGINQVSSDGLNSFFQTCTNMAQLRGFAGNNPSIMVYVRGTTSANDGGQGAFIWSAGVTGTDDNGVTTVVPNGVTVGCWTRQSAGTILLATSSTAVLIGTGIKTFVLNQSGAPLLPGEFVLIISRGTPANYMHGQVTGYSGTTLTVNITDIGGSGTPNDWNILLSGTQGPTGPAASTTVLTVSSSATPTLDLSLSRNFKYTTAQNTTFAFSNPDSTGIRCSFYVYLFQDGTGRTITWPATVKWPGGTPPTLTAANASYLINLVTINGGTTYYGLPQTAAFS